jgi:hypothetical protein
MSGKDAKEKGKKEAKAEGARGFGEMCRQMMSGKAPGCCGPEMRGVMSRWMAGFQAEAKK